MGKGNEERGYSQMKNLIKGYGREKRLGTAVGYSVMQSVCLPTFLRNVCSHTDYTALHPKRWQLLLLKQLNKQSEEIYAGIF
jgi:hypothetical protein